MGIFFVIKLCYCVRVCVGAGDAPPPYLNLFGMTSSVLQPPRVTFVPGPEESQGSVPNQQSQPSTTATTTRNNNNNNNTGCGSLYYEAATKNKPCTGESWQLFYFVP